MRRSGNAAVHETEAELFYVVDGSATLVTGGKLTGESRTNAENLTGNGIEGGTSRHVAKGDFVMVPERTAALVQRDRRHGRADVRCTCRTSRNSPVLFAEREAEPPPHAHPGGTATPMSARARSFGLL